MKDYKLIRTNRSTVQCTLCTLYTTRYNIISFLHFNIFRLQYIFKMYYLNVKLYINNILILQVYY